MTPAEVATYADMCRKHGVREVELLNEAGVRLRLVVGPLEAPLKPDAKQADPDICACGHSVFSHINGLCTANDCDPSKCVPSETK